MFQIGQQYSRRKDIHEVYGGSYQGGISPCRIAPYIFLFTGVSGEQYGYKDGWQSQQGIFLYTGQGQSGDMEFNRGNKAIRDHAANGKEILLFEALGKGQPVEFINSFSCASWGYLTGEDITGDTRQIIQFHLIANDSLSEPPDISLLVMDGDNSGNQPTLKELRERAFVAKEPVQQSDWKLAKKAAQIRSSFVREYVLARSKGICELSGNPAPFNKKDGSPYLEVHHLLSLSDNGLDDPRNCAAITPSAHREIHFGEHGEALNQQLIDKIAILEQD